MSLRDQVVRGGRQLVVREVVGIAVRTLGMLTLVRVIGPAEYGLFAGPLFIVTVLVVIATTGIDAFLLQRNGTLERRWLDQAFTLLLLTSTTVVLLVGGVAELVGSTLGESRVVLPLQVLLLSIPINILWNPARAKLERAFSYRWVAAAEISADVAQYAVALSLAFNGAGVWAPVFGFLARQAVMLVVCTFAAHYRPRLCWDTAMLREMLRFGVPLSAALLTRRAGDLVVPIIVGRYAGAAGVGIVALGIRLTETAAFLGRTMDRIALVALGRVQKDIPRLRNAVEEATAVQTLVLGAALAVFSNGTAFVLPAVLGPQWNAVAGLVPLLAANYLLLAMLTTQNAALLVLGRRLTVVVSNVAALAIFVIAALVLVPILGVAGYALAQALSLSAWYVKNRELRRLTGVSYRRALPWFLATMPLVLVPVLPWYGRVLAAFAPLLACASGAARRDLAGYLDAALRRRRATSETVT